MLFGVGGFHGLVWLMDELGRWLYVYSIVVRKVKGMCWIGVYLGYFGDRVSLALWFVPRYLNRRQESSFYDFQDWEHYIIFEVNKVL